MSETERGEKTSFQQGDFAINLAGNRLSAGNGRFLRTWRVDGEGRLRAESFHDVETNVEWLVPPPPTDGGSWTLALRALPKPLRTEAESLCAELTVTDGRTTRRTRLQVFSGCGGVRIRGELGHVSDFAPPDAEPSGIEEDGAPETEGGPSDALEVLRLAPLHLRLTGVTLRDQTDGHNELVTQTEWLLHPSEAPLRLRGCLFYVEDVLTGAGLIVLKEAPLPEARPLASAFDLQVLPRERLLTFADEGYAFVTLAYAGGNAGRIAALHDYQRRLRPYDPTRDGMLVSNTWGDRNRDARISAAFMAEEIEAGARLGVDVVQIDDGWQTGTTSNSVHAAAKGGVWEGFYAARRDFWEVHRERFPEGLMPLVQAARGRGLRFGLWFGPDSSDDFARWQTDADAILRLHREMRIDSFKIDGVKLRSPQGERNLRAFFDRVLTESDGRVVLDLDVTAETRPGYYGAIHPGPLFVENRYTDWWGYWPHQTLRNLWQLAHHVDPLRLRMEFLNHARNAERYADDPLSPASYRPDYLFATVMFSSPLGWFETSSLPETYFAGAAPLIATWKERRAAIFGGTILPLGLAPDGVSWTGFASVAPDRRSVFVLIFREASSRSEGSFDLPLLDAAERPTDATRLGGDGEATLLPGGWLRVAIPESHRFLFAHVRLPDTPTR